MDDKNVGVIQEQGFATGFGLGFTPVSEQDKEKLTEVKESNEK